MADRVRAELGAVQETLFIPLAARARETRRRRPVLRDPKAAEILASAEGVLPYLEQAPQVIGRIAGSFPGALIALSLPGPRRSRGARGRHAAASPQYHKNARVTATWRIRPSWWIWAAMATFFLHVSYIFHVNRGLPAFMCDKGGW
jgi:O-methyltransferase involved in polyketide biosynthesis